MPKTFLLFMMELKKKMGRVITVKYSKLVVMVLCGNREQVQRWSLCRGTNCIYWHTLHSSITVVYEKTTM